MRRLRIGICGAPGVGKSELAARLAERLEPRASVLDGYVPALQELTGLAFGAWADYSRNLLVAMNRYAAECTIDEHAPKLPRITVGTMIDTIMYAALYVDSAISYADQQASYARASTTMHALGMLINDTWSYDYCFWLRKPSHFDAGGFAAAYDQELATVIEAFSAPIVGLDQDSLEANVELAYGVIDQIERKQANESAQEAPALAAIVERGVRTSGEAGEAVGDADRRVPDMPRDED